MKTFLQHCKGVCREAGIANGEGAIASVIGNQGQLERIVSNVRQAWIEIQNRHQHSGLHWRWMRREFTLVTIAGQDSYAYDDGAITDVDTAAAIARWRNWMIKDFEAPVKCYLQSSGVNSEGWLTYIDWNDFRTLYKIGTQNPSRPAHITISPQNKLVVGPVPNDLYVITGDYLLGAQSFAADDDVPDLPESFEDVIMWKALSRHGLQKNAIELVTIGEDASATQLGNLEGDQLSEIGIGEALA